MLSCCISDAQTGGVAVETVPQEGKPEEVKIPDGPMAKEEDSPNLEDNTAGQATPAAQEVKIHDGARAKDEDNPNLEDNAATQVAPVAQPVVVQATVVGVTQPTPAAVVQGTDMAPATYPEGVPGVPVGVEPMSDAIIIGPLQIARRAIPKVVVALLFPFFALLWLVQNVATGSQQKGVIGILQYAAPVVAIGVTGFSVWRAKQRGLIRWN